MTRIPNENKTILQTNISDVLGTIWSSFNLDLTENRGRIRVSTRGIMTTSLTDEGNIRTPVAFQFFRVNSSARIYAIAGGKIFYNSGDPNDVFQEDTSAGVPTNLGDEADLEVFNEALYVLGDAANSSIYKLSSNGVWSTVTTSANGNRGRLLCVYGGRLYYTGASGGASSIGSVSLADVLAEPSGTPNTVLYTINLTNFGAGGSNANAITCIKASSNRIWIATIDQTSSSKSSGRGGKIFEWDGVSAQANKVYYLDSIGAGAMIIKGDIPYVFDADGRLLVFNGREFAEVARLPIPSGKYLKNPAGNVLDRFVHPKGMALRNGRILVLINNQLEDSNGTILENLPSGVWEYDENIGLYHKYSCTRTIRNASISDYGQNRVNEVGALFNCKSTSDDSNLNGDLMWGASVWIFSTSAEDWGVFINDTREEKAKIGYFVTTKIESKNIEDVWLKIYAKYKKLLDSSDRICIKYRTEEFTAVEGNIQGVDASTFTTTLDLSGFEIGDEVEITSGLCAGQIEHISDISESLGTYTVTLANPLLQSPNSYARFQKWKSLGEVTGQTTQWTEFSLPEDHNTSSWIQIKCVMYFTGINELNELQIINNPHLPSE